MTDVLEAGPNSGLLKAFGLTVEQAGDRAGLGRSSIQSGFADGPKKRPVLDPQDIVQLRESLHCLGRACDETAIIEHVRNRYDDKAVEYVREAFALMSTPFDFTAYSELWFTTPDVESLQKHGGLQFIFGLLAFPGKLTLFTGDPFQGGVAEGTPR